jgi:hypothetical protein
VTPAVTTEEPPVVPEVTDDTPEVTPEPDATPTPADTTPTEVRETEPVIPEAAEGKADAGTQKKFAQVAKDQGITTLNVGGLEIPLSPPAGYGYWSLLDAILTLLGLFIAVQKAYGLIRNRRLGQLVHADSLKNRKSNLFFLIVSFGCIIASVILFLLTQDLTKQMALFDWPSTAFTVLFAAQCVSVRLGSRNEIAEAGNVAV